MNAAWPTVALGDVTRLDLNRESIDPSKAYSMVGVLSFARGLFDREPIENGNTSYKHFLRLKPDHIVMSQLFGWEGALALSDERFAGKYLSPQFPTFLSDERKLDRKFLGWLMRRPGFWSDLAIRASGMGDRRRTLNPDAFFACQIPLPPLGEQRRIVTQVERLAAKVEEARTRRAESVEHQKAFIKSAIGSLFQKLEVRYQKRTLGSCNAHVSSGPRNWGKHYAPNGMRFYRAQDIDRDFKISNETVVFVEPPPGAQGRSAIVANGDLLIVITGATVGRVATYDSSHSPGLVSQHVAVCRIPPEKFLPRFAWWGLRGPDGQEQLLGSRYGQGKPGLNLNQVRALSLPCPPTRVQEEVVAELDTLQAMADTVTALQTQTAAELDSMLPAILDKAFKGEL